MLCFLCDHVSMLLLFLSLKHHWSFISSCHSQMWKNVIYSLIEVTFLKFCIVKITFLLCVDCLLFIQEFLRRLLSRFLLLCCVVLILRRFCCNCNIRRFSSLVSNLTNLFAFSHSLLSFLQRLLPFFR